MKTKKDIYYVVTDVRESIKALNISTGQKNRYISCCNEVLAYCVGNRMTFFGKNDASILCDTRCSTMKKSSFIEFRKIAFTLAAYCEEGIFQWKIITTDRYPISECSKDVLESFKEYASKSWSEGTVRVSSVIVRQFLFYLEHDVHTTLESLSLSNTLDFITQEAPNYPASMNKLLGSIRKFLTFLYDSKISNVSPELLTVKASKRRQKVLPCFSEETLNAILGAIDTSTAKGKRDYAIILLALRTGLRAADIAKMKLCDIDWQNSTIHVVQKKTCSELLLPLPTDAGNAVAEYILEFRVKCDNPYVFQRITTPEMAVPINSSAFNGYIRKYMQKAGINRSGWDGQSFHALRRTAGTSMVASDTPISTVAQILGHNSIESSKRYIRLDIEHLRDCCMELGALNTRKEGLV